MFKANTTSTSDGRLALRRSLLLAKVATVAGIALTGLITMGGTSGAATGYGPYQTTASPSLNERSAPSTSATVTGSLADHTKIYIACQTTGTSVDGSSIWDQLANGSYISDYWTTTPNVGTWSPPIPQCSAPASSYAYQTTASPSLNERSAPLTSATVTGSLADHTTIYIVCQTTGSSVDGSSIWDQLTNGSYVADYWTTTPNVGTWSPPIPQCGGTTTPPHGGYPYPFGETTTSHPGAAGQCTWGAEALFHLDFGVYVAEAGNALSWATSAAARGWTVKAYPAAPVANGSLAVFQPGIDGASAPYGHVAMVIAVSGSSFEIREMNGPAGPYNYDDRWVKDVSGVSFIYA